MFSKANYSLLGELALDVFVKINAASLVDKLCTVEPGWTGVAWQHPTFRVCDGQRKPQSLIDLHLAPLWPPKYGVSGSCNNRAKAYSEGNEVCQLQHCAKVETWSGLGLRIFTLAQLLCNGNDHCGPAATDQDCLHKHSTLSFNDLIFRRIWVTLSWQDSKVITATSEKLNQSASQ